ncbi:septation protein SepH [Aeromicrobium sp. CF3.5]|uniref:septation protein SepH n=1 Tax=Aeromicrobium sp. CF3.5 TaxID=3373078 RepID=UPI003EE7F058
MRELRFDAMSDDDAFVIARDLTTNEQFRVRLDPAARQRHTDVPPPATGSEPTMDIIVLSPRDIQTRVRRGESAQQVADSSGMALERIEAFAGPVVAEREYMAQQARKTSLRRKHVTGAGLPLGPVADTAIAEAGGNAEDATWDAWRRDDGRWSVLVTPPGSEATFTFVFDTASRYVVAADDAAHRFVGDVALPDTPDMAIADAVRSSAVDATDSGLDHDDAVDDAGHDDADREDTARLDGVLPQQAELNYDDDPFAATDQSEVLVDLPPDIAAAEALLHAAEKHHSGVSSLKAARDRRTQEALARQEVEAQADQAEADRQPHDEQSDQLEDSIDHDVAVPDTAGPRKKRGERRRVPSWDEIMFGGKDD